MTDDNHNKNHTQSHEGRSFAHLSISSPNDHDDDHVDDRVAVDGETATASLATAAARSHPNEANRHSDGDRKQDRRSSLRGAAKRRVVNSPRWRDQQEPPRRDGAQDYSTTSSNSDHPHHSHGIGGIAGQQHEHNDSASQTSRTDSHQSSLAALSDGELPHGQQHPFKDHQLHHLHSLSNNTHKFTSSHHHHHHHDNDSNSEGRLTPSHNNLSIHPIIHSETRFPTAMGYAPSEAAKSDIATVCSGSVIEDIDKDIDMASVASGEYPLKKTPSGGSTGLLGGHNMHTTTNASTTTTHHHHPNTPLQQSFGKHTRGDSNSHNTTSRGVEFASHTHTYPFHQNAPSHYLSTPADTEAIHPSSASASASDRSLLNDMGPPLSRTLLLVATAAANGEAMDHTSRAGSVRSFSTGEAPSDVVAHVDTDDCGGSINLSEVSQEDHKERNLELVPNNSTMMEPQNLGDAQTSVATTTNGRVSPGGTIYKGKGVRRYQGRYASYIVLSLMVLSNESWHSFAQKYLINFIPCLSQLQMKLPLKRFHQGDFNDTVGQNPLQEGDLYLHGDSDNDAPAPPPQWDDWSNSGYRSLSRSFSRSISPPPSRSRSRSRSESPRDNLRRRRPSWSPHRGSDRDNRRPIKGTERESPVKDTKNEPWSPTNRDLEPNRRSLQRNSSPVKELETDREGRWHRDHWNNRGGRREGRSRSRSRTNGRKSPRSGRKRKGSRSRS
eukprot:CCRYP_004875-RB/>CCRYP_004875-RB protein AED:0.10 eAED:0.10 QI:4211/1/0.90/1/0.4/0.36/11/4350/721